MRYRSVLLSTLFFAVSFTVVAHAADAPNGTYRKTCAVQGFRDSVLGAFCRPENNPNLNLSQIDVRACGGSDIFNRDGGLQCFAAQGWGSGRAVPRGTYINSCKNVMVANNQQSISAQCKDGSGNYRGTQLSTNGCPLGSGIDNSNGALVCRR